MWTDIQQATMICFCPSVCAEGEGFGPVMFHKAKLPRGIIGCIRVRDTNHCHTDANHCHGQNIAGSWGWNVYELSVEDMPERKSFLLGSLCLCNYSKNKLDKWSATLFSSTDSNYLVIFGYAHKQVFQHILCTKEWP